MGDATIEATVRDYNGFVITRDKDFKVVKMSRDSLSDQVKEKNKNKFGQRDDDGKLNKNGKFSKDEFTEQIKESNRRLKKWLQEQK